MENTAWQKTLRYLGLDGSQPEWRGAWWIPSLLAVLLWTGTIMSFIRGRWVWGVFELIVAVFLSRFAIHIARSHRRQRQLNDGR